MRAYRAKLVRSLSIRSLLGLCLILIIAGCDTPQSDEVNGARQQMVGMSVAETNVCLGAPANKISGSTSEIWTYAFGSCAIHLRFVKGQVTEAAYVISSKADGGPDDQCAGVLEVASCRRWLRNPDSFTPPQNPRTPGLIGDLLN